MINNGYTGEPEKADYDKNNQLEENKQNGFEENKDHEIRSQPGNDNDSKLEHGNQKTEEQLRIEALTEQAHKLMAQRDKLKKHFKELNSKLADTLKKVKDRNKPQKSKEEEKKKEDPLLKELDKINKQSAAYRREIHTLKNRIDSSQAQYRVQELENKLREKDREIQKLIQVQNGHEKIRRDQEKELDMFQNEYNYKGKIKAYNDEIKELRQKARKMVDDMREYDNKFKKQQEYLVVLEERHKDVCAQLGISSSLNFSTQEESNKMKTALSPKYRLQKKKKTIDLLKDKKYFGYDYDKEDEADAKLEFTKENFEKLRNECKNLKSQMYGDEKKTKGEMGDERQKMKEAEKAYQKAKEEYEEKETEVNILTHRLNEFKRMAKHNQMLVSQGKASLPEGLNYPSNHHHH